MSLMTLPWHNITAAVIVAATFALIVYDVIVIHYAGVPASISWTIWSWAKAMPLLPFAFGVLMGHFFWQMTSGK